MRAVDAAGFVSPAWSDILALFAFGSSCLLWKLSCIDFLKKLFQMCLGRGLENSSF